MINQHFIDLEKDGYDSDGCAPPWKEYEEYIIDSFIEAEKELPGERPVESGEVAGGGTPNPTDSSVVGAVSSTRNDAIAIDEIPKMKCNDIKIELKKRGLGIGGRKDDLVKRLVEAIQKGVSIVSENDGSGGGNMSRSGVAPGDCFDEGAYWQLLEEGEDVNDEDVVPDGLRAPTEPENEDRRKYGKKRNFNEIFDREVFIEETKLPRFSLLNPGKLMRVSYAMDSKIMYEKTRCTETVPNIDWCDRHGLSLESHPVHWFDAFLPCKNKPGIGNKFSIQKATEWTNLKAAKCGAGKDGAGKYPRFENFTLTSLMKHLSLYLFNGLNHSPQVEMKFQSQNQDPINGNNFIHAAFEYQAAKATLHHRHFKAFFAVQDPNEIVPSKETHPNHKVEPVLKQIESVSMKAMHIGRNGSIDEQTIGFQGNHQDKQRITYKKEGDGFLVDAICFDGYTYGFCFRNQPVSNVDAAFKTYKLSPLHLRVLALLLKLKGRHYTIGMDNLFMSAKLCRVALQCKSKVMLHGVTRPSMRGIPQCVKQKEVSKKSELEQVRHTVKAAVLRNDSVCKNLVAVSVYDTKPVYLLSNACEKVEWTTKKRKVWSPSDNSYVDMSFHRLNVINFYNQNMGNVDIADQLRNHYRYDGNWLRNRKWWWSVWWWAFQLSLTNSYIAYSKFHKMHGKEQPHSHYDFIKWVAMAWMAPETHWPGWGRKAAQRIPRAKIANEDETVSSARSVSTRSTRSGGSAARKSIQVLASAGNDKKAEVQRNNNIKRCITITDATLDKMWTRLDSSEPHFPICAKKKGERPRCQLHRWARDRNPKEEVRGANIMFCSRCQIHLCDYCWRVFHSETDIVSKKAEIAGNN